MTIPMELVRKIVKGPQLKRQGAHKTCAVDVRKGVGLVGHCAPVETASGFDLPYLHEHFPRAFGILIHPLPEKAGKIGLGNRLFGHGFASLGQELTSNILGKGRSSPIGKQIVNIAQLVLRKLGRVSDRVRLLPVSCQCNDTPVRLEAAVVDARNADGYNSVASRQATELLQYNQFQISIRDELLCHAGAPVRVATSGLLRSERLYASNNAVSAPPNLAVTVPSDLQIISLGQFDALPDHFAPKIRIVIVPTGHSAPASTHRRDRDRSRRWTARIDLKHQREYVFEILSGLRGEIGHLIALSSCDMSQTSHGGRRSGRAELISSPQLRPIGLMGGLNPVSDHVVHLFPVCGKGSDATFFDTSSESLKRIESLALGNVDFRGGAGSRCLGRQAIDQPSGIFFWAVESGPEDGAAVSSFQETYFVGHFAWLAVRNDSSCPVTDTKARRFIGRWGCRDMPHSVGAIKRLGYLQNRACEVAA